MRRHIAFLQLPRSSMRLSVLIRAKPLSESQHSQQANVGGSFKVGGQGGGDNGGDGPDDSTRKGIPHDSSKEEGEPDPESPEPGSSDARSAELAFRVSADLLQNDVPFQSLQARGTLKIKRTPESQDPSQFATCNVEFTALHMGNMCLTEENSVYHHFQLDIRIDAASKFTDTPHIRPLSTPEYNSEEKVSKGVKAFNALALASLSLMPTMGASAGRSGEESNNMGKVVNISRIMYREGNGVMLWKFHLVDRFEQDSGLTLSPEKLPLAHIVFGGDEAAPPPPPADLNVEIYTYWSIFSSPSRNVWTGSKPRFSNLCKIITFDLSKDLQGSHLYLSNLLLQVDVNPIVTMVEREVQVAETEHTASTWVFIFINAILYSVTRTEI